MSGGIDTEILIQTVDAHKKELWSELYGWLTADSRTVDEYCGVAYALADAAEFSLSQLVISQALSQHPDDEELALFILELAATKFRQAA